MSEKESETDTDTGCFIFIVFLVPLTIIFWYILLPIEGMVVVIYILNEKYKETHPSMKKIRSKEKKVDPDWVIKERYKRWEEEDKTFYIRKCPNCNYDTEYPHTKCELCGWAKEKEEIEEKRSRIIPTQVRHEVWRRDQGGCVECGSKENLEFDHIIPFSKGGSNTARNIQLLCEECNRKKYNKI